MSDPSTTGGLGSTAIPAWVPWLLAGISAVGGGFGADRAVQAAGAGREGTRAAVTDALRPLRADVDQVHRLVKRMDRRVTAVEDSIDRRFHRRPRPLPNRTPELPRGEQ